MESRILLTAPEDPYRRLIWASGFTLLAISILVPILANLIELKPNEDILAWKEGLILWLISFLLFAGYLSLGRKVTRAITYYILERSPTLLLSLLFLDGAARILLSKVGPIPLAIVFGGLVVGLGTLPWRVLAYQSQFRKAISDGYLSDSFDPKEMAWNAQYDNERWKGDRRVANPGCITRLLFWSGPAIGMGLADILGDLSANILMGLLALYLGYVILAIAITSSLGRAIEFRKMEKQAGTPISLSDSK